MNEVPIRYELSLDHLPVGGPWPAGVEAADYLREGSLPFISQVGMEIDCGDGDLRQITNVYWSRDDGFTVAFGADLIERDHEFYVEAGWIPA